MNVHRTLRALGIVALGVVGVATAGGCDSDCGAPQMLEPTRPRMDRERETGAPAVTTEPRPDAPTPGGETRSRDLRPASAPVR